MAVTTQIVNGVEIIRGLDIDDYHKSPILSHTKLQHWAEETPEWWEAKYIKGLGETTEKEHFLVGRALDVLVFDGLEEFRSRFVVRPETYPAAEKQSKKDIDAGIPPETTPKPWHSSAKYCQEWEAAQREEGKSVLSPDQIRSVKIWWNALKGNEHFARLYTMKANGQRTVEFQVTLRWKDPEDGIWYQARPDAIDFHHWEWWDLKSTRSIREVGKQFAFLGYHLQAGLVWRAMTLLRGAEPRWGGHAYVEKSYYPRTEVKPIFGPEAGPIYVEAGWSASKRIAAEIEAAKAKGEFRYRQKEMKPLIVPEWIQRKWVEGEEVAPEEFLPDETPNLVI